MEKKLVKKLEKIGVDSAELRLRIEKLEKEKEALEEKVKQLKLDTEVHSAVNRMEGIVLASRAETRQEIKSLEQTMSEQLLNLHNEIKKILTDFSMTNYETQAIAIENEERRKKKKEELTEKFSQMIIGLQDTIEKKISESHNAIMQNLAHFEKKVTVVDESVVEKTIVVLGQRDTMLILKENKWMKLSLKLPADIYNGGAVCLNGEVYIFGGYSGKDLYKLDSKALKWRQLADMNEERMYITNSCLEWTGYIWVFGGVNKPNGKNYLQSGERYDPKEDEWTRVPDMKYPRSDAAASVHNGKFIICGGCNDCSLFSSVECFDPESGTWTELTKMPVPGHHYSLVSFENRLILMGGYGGTVWELTEEGTWKELPSMNCSRRAFGVAVVDKEIYVIGRDEQGVEIFNGETWREGPPLPYDRNRRPSLVIPKHLADTLCTHTACMI